MPPLRVELLTLIESAYAGPAWHGASLLTSLKGVDAEAALWRPAPERPNVWEHVLHSAYARHRVMGRLDPSMKKRFPRKLARSLWAASPEIGDAKARSQAWADDRALLDDFQRQFLTLLGRISETRLRTTRRGTRFTYGDEAAGIALHDTYHAGQIRLVLRLKP